MLPQRPAFCKSSTGCKKGWGLVGGDHEGVEALAKIFDFEAGLVDRFESDCSSFPLFPSPRAGSQRKERKNNYTTIKFANSDSHHRLLRKQRDK